MSFNYIIKHSIFILFIFILSCQDKINDFYKKNKIEVISESNNLEKKDVLDTIVSENFENNIYDYYTYQLSNYDFLNPKLHKIKINNYEARIKNNYSVNIFFHDNKIYSVNSKGEILKFNVDDGKLLERLNLKLSFKNKKPVSFSFIDNDFIIGFRSGEVIRINNKGELKWSFKKNNLLNTPIKIKNNNLFILYPEDLIILNPDNGKPIYEKNYSSNNIIQASGGKLASYFNFIYFILPNNEFQSLDTLLFDAHITKLNSLDIINSLNNLDDQIHVYKNIFLYLDNGNILNTYDLINNQFIISNYKINNLKSSFLFNNSLIVKNNEFINFYNLLNGNIFSKIKINKILNEKTKIISVMTINNKLHLFFDNGKLLIVNKDFNVENVIDLKIKKINHIYSYQNKIFVSTEKGFTYIFK